jgi:aryl-alcohol dehydrogenase-like predicted oxidoreductase
MSAIDASASGQFRIGDIAIHRLGYGAMRLMGAGIWGPPSDRKAALATLRRLPEVGAVRQLLDAGIIRHAGLSEVSVTDIEAARRMFPVATVQNRYNLVDRGSENVLAYCAANSIGFIPWFPLAAGELTEPGGSIDRIAKAHGATAGQVALAWLLQRSPVMLPIPGTLRVAHLEENVSATDLSLTRDEIVELDAAA